MTTLYALVTVNDTGTQIVGAPSPYFQVSIHVDASDGEHVDSTGFDVQIALGTSRHDFNKAIREAAIDWVNNSSIFNPGSTYPLAPIDPKNLFLPADYQTA